MKAIACPRCSGIGQVGIRDPVTEHRLLTACPVCDGGGGMLIADEGEPLTGAQERVAVVAYLRRVALESHKGAERACSGDPMSQLMADSWIGDGVALDEAADAIEQGRHWK